MDRLARLIYRRRRLVLASTVVFVLFAVAYGGPVVSLLDSDDDFEDHGSESVLARDAVERATGRSASPDMVVLVRLGAPVDSPEAQAKIARVAQQLEHPDVADVVAVRDGEPAELVSRDGRSTYLLAIFGTDADDDELAEELQARVEREPGVTAGGGQLAFAQVGEQVEQDLARAEMLGLPAALPALARGLPQRGGGAAAGAGRRHDDHHHLRLDAACRTRSSRCRCSPST